MEGAEASDPAWPSAQKFQAVQDVLNQNKWDHSLAGMQRPCMP